MKAVFADTAYWVAIFRPGDPWRFYAIQARETIRSARLVTTDEVLIEFLAALSAAGTQMRLEAAGFVRDLLSHPDIHVFPQSRETFLAGLALYEARPDKNYSLTDCISMNVMRSESITAALTSDRHFVQEGFSILMQKQ